MDIAALAMHLSSSSLNAQVKMGFLKKAMDTRVENDTMLIDMMKQIQASVQPHLGQNIDILA